jgi:acyl-CoA dehydrogenase
MDFDDGQEEARFRSGVRAWLAEYGPRYVPAENADDADVVALAKAWQSALADAGYAGFGFPAAIGGRPGALIEQVIFNQEVAGHPMTHVEIMVQGCAIALPTILAHGSAAQIERLGRATIRGDVIWCQLFSEPGAGSDLAGIRTSARAVGDQWEINGQKVWTSGALYADWGLLVARTDPDVPKHKGLTYFLLDMKSAGVTVRPLRQMGGRAEFNEVFLDDVRIPDSMRLGGVGDGWKVAIATLSNERLGLLHDSAVSRNLIAPLLRIAARTRGADGTPVLEDSLFQQRLASYYAAVSGVEQIGNRIITALSQGSTPGPEATIGKVTLTRHLQLMAGFGLELAGMSGATIDQAGQDDLYQVQQGFFLAPGYRMGGGTEEIAKNIIAERVLGLPPDHRLDKDLPFSALT